MLTGNTVPQMPRHHAYLLAAMGVVGMTVLIRVVPGAARIGNISVLYLLVIIAIALRCGSGAAIAASVLAFLAFDFFFVDPRHTFTVTDPAEWVALVIFLVTAATTGHLTASLRQQAMRAELRERETAALAEAHAAVASQISLPAALQEVMRRCGSVAPLESASIWVPAIDRVEIVAHWAVSPYAAGAGRAPERHLALVRHVLEHSQPVGWADNVGHWRKALHSVEEGPDSERTAYLPLTVENRVVGVLEMELHAGHQMEPRQRGIVESLAASAALALERDRLLRTESAALALSEADRLKTALLSMVSHDFRSPLTGIKAGVSSLLQEGGSVPPEVERELLQGIEQEADRLNRMVGNILALSRLEADAWRPQCEWMPMSELIGTALQTFSTLESGRVTVHLDATVPEVWVDPVQMVQVLRNLLENALKYGDPALQVEVRATCRGSVVELAIMDFGPGLPTGDEGRIWEPFYRAPALRESALPGVGVGLAVCRGLAEAHGGTLTAVNRNVDGESVGAVFTLRLPNVPMPAPSAPDRSGSHA